MVILTDESGNKSQKVEEVISIDLEFIKTLAMDYEQGLRVGSHRVDSWHNMIKDTPVLIDGTVYKAESYIISENLKLIKWGRIRSGNFELLEKSFLFT